MLLFYFYRVAFLVAWLLELFFRLVLNKIVHFLLTDLCKLLRRAKHKSLLSRSLLDLPHLQVVAWVMQEVTFYQDLFSPFLYYFMHLLSGI
jgi:hypothetical protein